MTRKKRRPMAKRQRQRTVNWGSVALTTVNFVCLIALLSLLVLMLQIDNAH